MWEVTFNFAPSVDGGLSKLRCQSESFVSWDFAHARMSAISGGIVSEKFVFSALERAWCFSYGRVENHRAFFIIAPPAEGAPIPALMRITIGFCICQRGLQKRC